MPSSGGGTRRAVASTSARRGSCCCSPRPPAMPCAGCSRSFPDPCGVTSMRLPCWERRCDGDVSGLRSPCWPRRCSPPSRRPPRTGAPGSSSARIRIRGRTTPTTTPTTRTCPTGTTTIIPRRPLAGSRVTGSCVTTGADTRSRSGFRRTCNETTTELRRPLARARPRRERTRARADGATLSTLSPAAATTAPPGLCAAAGCRSQPSAALACHAGGLCAVLRRGARRPLRVLLPDRRADRGVRSHGNLRGLGRRREARAEPAAMRALARALVAAIVLAPATAVLAADALPSYGLVQLRGVPDGARIDLDGRPWLVAEGLDGRWLVVARGSHRLTIHLPDHEPREQRIDVVDGRAQVVRFTERPVKRR